MRYEKVNIEYSNTIVWTQPLDQTIPEEGLTLSVALIKDAKFFLKPEDFGPFKRSSEHPAFGQW